MKTILYNIVLYDWGGTKYYFVKKDGGIIVSRDMSRAKFFKEKPDTDFLGKLIYEVIEYEIG